MTSPENTRPLMRNVLHIGDALAVLKRLPSDSIHCMVTSPPYFSLRDYGVSGQLGLEQSPDEYLDKLVAIFREARRVLRGDGTCWVNIGDSYATSGGNRKGAGQLEITNSGVQLGGHRPQGYKEKDMMLIPFRLALALQADNWWVRQTNIRHKPSCMPQSVTDRTTTDFEYVFHLTKQAHYWYDADAIREPSIHDGKYVSFGDKSLGRAQANMPNRSPSGNALKDGITVGAFRNKRTVWTIASEPFSEAHFAIYPQALPEICIAAGCPETCCAVCGKGYRRVVEKEVHIESGKRNSANGKGLDAMNRHGDYPRASIAVTTLGFAPDCTCNSPDTLPGVVLDMFGGAGTTALAAKHLGRDYVLIELNPRYVEMAQKRIRAYDPFQHKQLPDGPRQLSLFAEVSA